MTVLPNSFRVRAAEFNRGRPSAFCHNFAVEVLDSLEPRHFDLPVVLRSVPGTGKTSLMQVLSAPWLVEVVRRPNDYEALVERLTSIGVLDPEGRPLISGALINLERDFSAILDVGAPDVAAERIFKRLVDARVLSAHLASARTLAAVGTADMAPNRITLVIPPGRPDLSAILHELGGDSDDSIDEETLHRWALETERVVRTLLFDLDPFDWDRTRTYSRDFVSFKLLEVAEIYVDGRGTGLRPVTFLDDLHRLRPQQREQIISLIESRAVTRGLWVAERIEVLNAEQLVGDDTAIVQAASRMRAEEGRDREVLDLAASTVAPRFAAYERMLKTVARNRAATDLQNYADTGVDFLQLLDENDEVDWASVEQDLTSRLERVGDARFVIWVDHLLASAATRDKTESERIKDMRGGLSLIEAEQRKEQAELFLGLPFAPEDLDKRLTSSVREAALVALGREYPGSIPVYYGQRAFLALANHNVSQLLRVAADLFDVVLGAAANGRMSPAPTPRQQHRTIKTTSDRFWREIPSRLDEGVAVQTLLQAAGQFAARMNEQRPTSYAPGISGFAMTMKELRTLLRPQSRATVPGGEELVSALAGAVANNYMTKLEDAPRGALAERRVIFYINRLLCPQWGLPLGRGGYRTKSVHEIAGWMKNRRPTAIGRDLADMDAPDQGEALFDE